VHVVAEPQQVDGRLVDADVRLDAAQENLPPLGGLEGLHDLFVPAAAEVGLRDARGVGQQRRNRLDRGPELLRDLLGDDDGNAEDLHAPDELPDVFQQELLVLHGFVQVALHIDDEQDGILNGK